MAHTKVDVPGPELAPEPVPAQQNEGDSSPSGSGKDNTPTDDAHEKLGRVPLRVGRLKIKGNTYTRSGFILNELNPLRQAGTFAELQREIVNVTEELRSLDIFSSISVLLDKGKEPETADVKVRVKEKRRIGAKISDSMDSTENQMEGELLHRNLFGRAERLSIGASYGWRSGLGFSAGLELPRVLGSKFGLGIHGFNGQTSFARFSSFMEKNRVMRFCLTHKDWPHHVLEYEGNHREVKEKRKEWDLSEKGRSRTVCKRGGNKVLPELWTSRPLNEQTPCRSVLQDSVPSVKSSIKHTMTIDSRDDVLAPSVGALFKLKSELAGLGGDVQFAKAEFDTKYYYPVTSFLSLGVSLQGGIIRPLGSIFSGLEKRVRINDRFFLGGPLSVRGFGPRRLGPAEQGDAIGGELYGAAGLSASCPIPITPFKQIGARTRVFANCGNLLSLSGGSSSLRDRVSSLASQMRCSVGVGLVVPIKIARFELNYVRPLRQHAPDQTERIQFGLGVDWL